MAKCAISGCDNKLSTHARCKTCPTCRSSMGNYLRKPLSALTERVRKLALYSARMVNISGHKKRSW